MDIVFYYTGNQHAEAEFINNSSDYKQIICIILNLI